MRPSVPSQRPSPLVQVPWQQCRISAETTHPVGLYIHVPFCTSRCGYCDFTTYALQSFPGDDPIGRWVAQAQQDIRYSATLCDRYGITPPPLSTIFIGGGTPSLLGDRLADLLATVREVWPLSPTVEITTEANPESTSPDLYAAWVEAGVTRVSLGMQSVQPHLLSLLQRQHTPDRALQAVEEAAAAGIDHINLDLIYGIPGETTEDVQVSLDAMLSVPIDHISAYALTIEPGTALYRRVRHGEIGPIDDDRQAEHYELVDQYLQDAGYGWYEISNWARCDPDGSTHAHRCQHNMGYWTGGQWWAVGPGAHASYGGVRWSMTKNPRTYAAAVQAGEYPADWYEVLGPEEQREERIMLGMRVADGFPLSELSAQQQEYCARAIEEGLLRPIPCEQPGNGTEERVVLTRQGRLLADRVVMELLTTP